MKWFLVAASLVLAPMAQAGLFTLNLPGDNTGMLATNDGWNMEDTMSIDFYTFELMSDTELDFTVSAVSSIGLSLYAGEMTTDPGFLFSNSGDFIDFMGNNFAYITGTNPFFPGAGNNALNTGNLIAGWYTLAVGGNEGFDFGGTEYVLTSTYRQVQASEPATFSVILLALAGLLWQQRRMQR
ncbi:PEP-CTERM sorting domain-containing protein [Aestuariibacter sp. A3R04]|uniref:PEP-CTERM sorting domain-containing protein n=1 Tax=Aestuariibacter sp. A3R04 TaxID=2841571 RepID=UPI001C08EB11|nr:PEP-CTERM sorting domain-containing protein [Aestuariibacter sp. A3R04]MBU3023443.1 PEP-CTERM sorting domain-containing protein [Aestuariibacter sp. A3R04]